MKYCFHANLVWSAFAFVVATSPSALGQSHVPPSLPTGTPMRHNGISACQVGIYEYAGYVAIRDRGLAETAVPVQALDGPEKLEIEAARRAVAHQIWSHPDWDATEVKRRYMIKCQELESGGRKPPPPVDSLL